MSRFGRILMAFGATMSIWSIAVKTDREIKRREVLDGSQNKAT